jgi:predicted component of type VI protein secretion system
MKLTESQLRSVVREELSNVLEMYKQSKEEPLATAKNVAGGTAMAGLAAAPFAIAQYLQTNPEMMKKVVDMLKVTGDFLQNLEEE